MPRSPRRRSSQKRSGSQRGQSSASRSGDGSTSGRPCPCSCDEASARGWPGKLAGSCGHRCARRCRCFSRPSASLAPAAAAASRARRCRCFSEVPSARPCLPALAGLLGLQRGAARVTGTESARPRSREVARHCPGPPQGCRCRGWSPRTAPSGNDCIQRVGETSSRRRGTPSHPCSLPACCPCCEAVVDALTASRQGPCRVRARRGGRARAGLSAHY